MKYIVGEPIYLVNLPNIVFLIANVYGSKVRVIGRDFRLELICDKQDLLSAYDLRSAQVTLPILKTNTDFKVKTGKVLHIDGDEYYLQKAMQVYKYYGVNATGYYVKENQLVDSAYTLVKKHQPDIVIITGHDAIVAGKEEKLREVSSYQCSQYFAEATKVLRDYRSSLDDLIIISGACQSYYELLIESGSNFASSPTRSFIHLLDPVLIATQISLTLASERVEPSKIIENTITKKLGGLDSFGKARKIFNGGTT